MASHRYVVAGESNELNELCQTLHIAKPNYRRTPQRDEKNKNQATYLEIAQLRESLTTSRLLAKKWLIASMSTHVDIEMGLLIESLPTSRKRALVLPP